MSHGHVENKFMHAQVSDYQVPFIPSCISGRLYKIGPVCLSVCLLVSTLTAELFDLRSQNLV